MTEIAGAAADLEPTWEGVLHAITSRQRRRSRQRMAALATVAVLVAVTTGIVVDRAQPQANAAGAPDALVAPGTTASTEPTNEPASTTTSLVPVTTMAPIEGGIEHEIFGQQQYEPLFVENIGRHTLRFFSMKNQMFSSFGPLGMMPGVPPPSAPVPDDCLPRQLTIEISDDQMATQVGLAVGGDPRFAMMSGGMTALLQPIGIAERAPAWLAVVPVLPTQRAAKVAFPNGVVVDATVRDGLAIAILADSALDWRSMGLAPTTKIDLGEGLVRPRVPRVAARDECRPPEGMFGPAIQLPAPGEPPQNVLAATTAIEDLVILFADFTRTKEERVADVHEPGDLVQVLESLASFFGPGSGGFGPGGFGGFGPGLAEPIVASLVFTSPSEAAAEVIMMGGGSVRADFVLVADRWLLSRPGACEILNRMSPGCNVGAFPPMGPGPGPMPLIAEGTSVSVP
ncbi:MAG: hypothetical protein ACKV2O_06695 [Acidimicrobiales bacterium]